MFEVLQSQSSQLEFKMQVATPSLFTELSHIYGDSWKPSRGKNIIVKNQIWLAEKHPDAVQNEWPQQFQHINMFQRCWKSGIYFDRKKNSHLLPILCGSTPVGTLQMLPILCKPFAGWKMNGRYLHKTRPSLTSQRNYAGNLQLVHKYRRGMTERRCVLSIFKQFDYLNPKSFLHSFIYIFEAFQLLQNFGLDLLFISLH